jgi:hypothetical protein
MHKINLNMDYVAQYGLLPGDQIVEALFVTGMTKHFALYLGEDIYGQQWIEENHHLEGVRVVAAPEYFAAAGRIARIDRFSGSNAERRQVVLRALQLAGKPYDLINYNCEHFVNEASSGRAVSRQVGNLAAGILLFLLFRLLAAED